MKILSEGCVEGNHLLRSSRYEPLLENSFAQSVAGRKKNPSAYFEDDGFYDLIKMFEEASARLETLICNEQTKPLGM